MKFYFCETCGKRLTENDIEGGVAKDKKLKGVFCRECSIGVTTMETMPLTKDQAQEILDQESSASGSKRKQPDGAAKSARRRTSGAQTIPRRRESDRALASGPRPAQSPWGIYAGVGFVCAVLLVVGIVALTGSSTTPTNKKVATKKKKSSERSPVSEARSAVQGPQEPDAPTNPAPSTEPTGQTGDGGARPEPGDAPPTRPESAKPILPTPQSDTKDPSDAEPEPSQPDPATSSARTPTDTKPKPAAKKPENPVEVMDAKTLARMAYLKFSDAFLSKLRDYDVASASELLQDALGNAVMAPVKADLESDKRAISFIQDADRALPAGVEKLKTVEQFVLKTTKGQKMAVGRRGPFKVNELKDEKLYVGNRGMEMPLPLETLDDSTRKGIIWLGVPDNPRGLTVKAFLRVLDLSAGDGPGVPSEKLVQADIERARKAGGKAGDLDYIQARMEVARSSGREMAAALAWSNLVEHGEKNRWKAQLEGLRAFAKSFGDTRCAKERKKEYDRLFLQAQEQVELVEGYRFDFKTKENFDRFKAVFSKRIPSLMTLHHETGKAVFKPIPRNKWPKHHAISYHFEAPGVILGRHWHMKIKLNLNIQPKDLSDSARREAGFDIRFLIPGEKPNRRSNPHNRVQLRLHKGHGGYFTFAFRGWHQNHNGEKSGAGPYTKEGPFLKLVKAHRGFCGGSFLSGKKPKPPAAADGSYRMAVVMKGQKMECRLNGVTMHNGAVPSDAAEHIAKSRLSFFASAYDPGITLHEFYFKQDKPEEEKAGSQ